MTDHEDESTPLFWQKLSKPKPVELVVNNDKTPYVAFETQDKLRGFVVDCPSTNLQHTFFFHHILSITLNTPGGDFFSIITSNAVIRVYGSNLKSIVTALGLHNCKSFSEFHPLWFDPPTDDSQPFIERIEVLLPMPANEKNQEGRGTKQREEV